MECKRAPLSPAQGSVGMFWGLNAYCRICWGRVSFTLATSLTIRKAVLDSVENQAEVWNRGPAGANEYLLWLLSLCWILTASPYDSALLRILAALTIQQSCHNSVI